MRGLADQHDALGGKTADAHSGKREHLAAAFDGDRAENGCGALLYLGRDGVVG